MNYKFKSLLFLITTCLTSVAAMAQTQPDGIQGKRQILFNSANIKTTPYRIPAIVTMSNGEILAIADQRPCGADVGHGEVDIYARISADNGTTWSGTDDTPHDNTSDVIKIADGDSDCGYGDAAVVAHPTTGEVMVLSVGGSSVFGETKSSSNTYFVKRHYSSDYGRTWKTSDLTTQFKGSSSLLKSKDVGSMFFASGRILLSKNPDTPGRIYAALLTSENASKFISWSDKNYNYVFYSDDFGVNWKMLGSDYAIDGGDEAKVEELPNGDIVISSKSPSAGGTRIFNVYSMTNEKWGSQATYSFGGGNKTNGELMLYKGLYKVGETTGLTYDVLLQSLPTADNRANVSVFYKEVAANTTYTAATIATGWTKGVLVYEGNSAYSAMTIMPNGQIGFLYEQDYYSKNSGDNYKSGYASGGTADITFVPLTVEEITGGAYTTKAPASTPVDPTFTLSTTTAELTAGETLQLSLTNTSDGTVTYTSGNTAVATVDANGVVTAVAEGTATIKASVTATNKYNAAEATCTITVKAAVEPDPEEPETPDTPELTTITVTAKSGKIGSSTYYVATFSHEKPMTVPNGVKAYYVKAAGSDEVTLTRVTSGKAIPAGQGVILISTSTGTFVMTESDGTNVADLTDNLLKATLNNGTMTFTANDYVLAVKGSGDWKGYFAFCKTAAGTVVENYVNRAYLQLSTSEANIRMRFDDDATAIGSIENDADKTPVYYDLMGRRVDNPTKGIYIVNGKKVLVR